MQAPPAWVLKLEVPKPTPFPFESVFKQVEQSTTDELKRVSHLRDEVAGAITKSSPEAAMKAIERYIPSLLGLISTVESLPPDSFQSLKVSWTTPLYVKYQYSPFSYGSLKFEWHMILLSYGILHRNAAMDLFLATTDSDFDEKSKQVANLLCKAAGIFEFLRGEAGRWLVKPDPVFTELKDDTLVALTSLSLAEAQLFTIKKAVLKATSGKVVAKLCMDVVQKCEASLLLLKPMTSAYEPGLLTLVGYTTVTMDLFKALALKCEAIELAKANQFGASVGYMGAALAAVPEDKAKSIKPLDWLFKEVRSQREDMQRLFDAYSADNSKIYFELVPDSKSISFPEGKSLMKPVPYVSPPVSLITFIPKQGSSCILQ